MSVAPQSLSCSTPQPMPAACARLVAWAHRAGGGRFHPAAELGAMGERMGEIIAATCFLVASLPARLPGMRHRLFRISHPVSGIWLPTYRMPHRVARMGRPVCGMAYRGYRMAKRGYRMAKRGYPMAYRRSRISHPVSGIRHPLSGIGLPVSRIGLPVFRMPHPGGRKWAKSAIFRKERPFAVEERPNQSTESAEDHGKGGVLADDLSVRAAAFRVLRAFRGPLLVFHQRLLKAVQYPHLEASNSGS